VVLVRDAGAVVGTGQAKQTHYAYDGLNQLVQAWQNTVSANATAAPGMVKVSATDEPTAVWRYHQDSLGNRLIAQDQQGSKQGPLLQMAYKPDSSEAIEPSRDPKQPNRRWRWNADGTLAAAMQTTTGAGEREIASYHYNHQGLRVVKTVNSPEGSSHREYTLYDTQRHRIADLDAQGRISRQYVWIDDLLLAVIDAQQPAAPASVDPATAQTSAWSNMWGVWGALFHASRIAYVHSNHLGAPVAVSDDDAKPIWRASYSPYGQRLGDTPKMRLPGQWEDAETGLHYNDQRYYDPAVGRYISADPLGLDGGFNAHAYVGNNPLGFADPLGLVLFAFDGTDNTTDPAFLARKGSSLSNVVEFFNAYKDGNARYVSGVGTDHIEPTGSKYKSIIAADYTGYGGKVPDIGGNYSGKARIDRMVEYFSDEARAVTDKTKPMDVDIVGFSRGAAQARDFANRLMRLSPGGVYKYKDDQGQQVCQQLNFRFMGLFDTVLSQNEPSYRYTLGIPLAFQYVAQAVALNEYRSRVTASTLSAPDNFGFWDDTRNHIADQYHYGWFGLESITGSGTPKGKVRNELGFLGAHADIGGSYGPGENQLSLVALSWMVGQAQIAGVKMSAPKAIDMSNPIVHDQSNAIRWGNPIGAQPVLSRHLKRYGPEDREVRGACNPDVPNGPCKGGLTTQRQMRFDVGNGVSDNRSMTNADTHSFIDYTWRDQKDQPAILYKGTNNVANPNSVSSLRNRTGTVKMDDYMNWLRGHGYVFYGEW
jgi:RHS repeat-associated protein